MFLNFLKANYPQYNFILEEIIFFNVFYWNIFIFQKSSFHGIHCLHF